MSTDESGAGAPESSPPDTGGTQAIFATTHWSIVLSAQKQDEARSTEALEQLCRAYWYPLYAYARRTGQSPADAEDLTQGFFVRLVEKDFLKAAVREKGRFRTFLLVALKRYMANEWDRQHAQKRGGFARVISIDQQDAESRLRAEPFHTIQPDALFDRQWALTLLDRAMKQLKEEYVASGRAKLFEYLHECLAGDASALPYAAIGARLELTEAAVKMAIHRLRARYREILRSEIAQTVTSAKEVEQELADLFAAFG